MFNIIFTLLFFANGVEFSCPKALAVFLLGKGFDPVEDSVNQELVQSIHLLQNQEYKKLNVSPEDYIKILPNLRKELSILKITADEYAKRVSHANEMIRLVTDNIDDYLPDVQTRIKTPGSLYAKLQRKLQSKNDHEISRNLIIMQILNDVVGVRLTLKDLSIDEMHKALIKLIQDNPGVNISYIENYHGENTIPYISEEQMSRLLKDLANVGVDISKIQIPTGNEAIKSSGYTAVHFGIIMPDGSLDLQLRGPLVSKIAELEHKFYQLRQERLDSNTNVIPKEVIQELSRMSHEDKLYLLSTFSTFINSILTVRNGPKDFPFAFTYNLNHESMLALRGVIKGKSKLAENITTDPVLFKQLKDFIENLNPDQSMALTSSLYNFERIKMYFLLMFKRLDKLYPETVKFYIKAIRENTPKILLEEIFLQSEIIIMPKEDVEAFETLLRDTFKYARELESSKNPDRPLPPNQLQKYQTILSLINFGLNSASNP